MWIISPYYSIELEETAKSILYRQLVPFLVKALNAPDVDPAHLSSAAIAGRIEFSRLGIEDPGDIITRAENKLYEMCFGKLREVLDFSKDSKVCISRL